MSLSTRVLAGKIPDLLENWESMLPRREECEREGEWYTRLDGGELESAESEKELEVSDDVLDATGKTKDPLV